VGITTGRWAAHRSGAPMTASIRARATRAS
jgi:hypothetical protein